MKQAHRVLAFGCHPDDVEFICAGTLALLAQKGCEIHIAIMAGGDVGSPTLPRAEIREQRLKEAQAAADVIGARFHFAGGEDLEVEYNDEYRRRAVRVMRAVNPTIVFTHPPMDYLIDHEETSRLVRNAAFIGPVPNYDCGAPVDADVADSALVLRERHRRAEDIFGRPLPLTCAVDISTVHGNQDADARLPRLAARMAARHHEVRRVSGPDAKAARPATVARAGVAHAEGFIQHRGEGHPQDNVLKAIARRRLH